MTQRSTKKANRSGKYYFGRMESLEPRQLLTTFAVTNLLDGPVNAPGELPGSLRQAVFDANTNAGPDSIEFAEGLSGTIELTAGQLIVVDSLGIDGPAENDITVSGGNATRVFLVSQTELQVDDLAIVDGLATDLPVPLPPDAPTFSAGAGILNLSGSVELNDVHFSGHESTGSGLGLGAAISNLFGASLTVNDSTFTDNLAFGFALGVGGAIINDASSTLIVRGSSFHDNEVQTLLGADPENPFVGGSSGGAVATAGSSVTRIYSSEFVSNRALGSDGMPGMEDGANGTQAGNGFGGAVSATGITLLGQQGESLLYVADSSFRENLAIGGRGGDGGPNADGGQGGVGNGAGINAFDDVKATVVRSEFVGNQAVSGRGGDGGVGGNGGNAEPYGGGGGIFTVSADLTVVNSTFTENLVVGGTGGDGGAGGNGGDGPVGASSGAIAASNSIFDPTLPTSARIISSELVDNVVIGGDGGKGGDGETADGRGGVARGGAISSNAGENTAGMDQGPVTLISVNNHVVGNVVQGGTGTTGGDAIGGGFANFENQLGEKSLLVIRNTTVEDNAAVGGVGTVASGIGRGGGVYNTANIDVGSRDLDHVFGNSSDACQDVLLSEGNCSETGPGEPAAAASSLVGDLDGDGRVGVSDIAALDQAIADLSEDAKFDVNADEVVSSADSQFFAQILGTTPGDANLDGFVNFLDFLALAEQFGAEGTATWSGGDFDGDGSVNFADFLILANNFGG